MIHNVQANWKKTEGRVGKATLWKDPEAEICSGGRDGLTKQQPAQRPPEPGRRRP